MDLKQFAEHYRLKIRQGEDGEPVILGKFGHLYEHNQELFGLMFIPPEKVGTDKRWGYAKRKFETRDFVIWQDGDYEGSALFDPANRSQARLALKVAGIKRKRRVNLTPKQLANLKRPPAGDGVSILETQQGE